MLAAKRLLQKAVHHSHHNVQHSILTPEDLNLRVTVHYGVPSTASILAVDPVQRLLAAGTLDGRIKVFGGDGIEGILMSPKQLPYKNLEFLHNEGYLVSVSHDNDIQVWSLDKQSLVCFLQWESNITAFSVIINSYFMYVGDEHGVMSVLKFNVEEQKLLLLPYHISSNSISEAAGLPFLIDAPIVGVLHQPCSSGNRVLIAYSSGLVVLWDVYESQVLYVGNGEYLQLKDDIVESSAKVDCKLPKDSSDNHLGEKEISALCWASSNGSILGVGYTDGDILLWKVSMTATDKVLQDSSLSRSVVKLQLSSAEKRLPVIVLHWSPNHNSNNYCDGQLFIYGGDEIGSEEVLTIITIEWSSGMDILRCVGRVDLPLNGSFADMILLPGPGAFEGNHRADLFVLTNPGQLLLYDGANLAALMSKSERNASVPPMNFLLMIPMADPLMTAAKLIKLPTVKEFSKDLSGIECMKFSSSSTPATVAKWPLTGGVPSQLSTVKDKAAERIYAAGYIDGSVRLYDSTYPVLSFMYPIKGEIEGIKVAGTSAPVTKLDICTATLSLAVGNECGLVRIYRLNCGSDETTFYFITGTKREVHNLPQGKEPHCRAVFSLLNSPIQALQFSNCGDKLGVGFRCGRLAVLAVDSLSILSIIEVSSSSFSPVISLTWKAVSNLSCSMGSPRNSETKFPRNMPDEVLFMVTKNADIYVIDGKTGNLSSSQPWHLKKELVALSMYIIDGSTEFTAFSNERHADKSSQDANTTSDSIPNNYEPGVNPDKFEHHTTSETSCSRDPFSDSLVLLCCEDSLRLYSTKGVVQGNNKTIRKIKQPNCCWTTTFEKNGQVCGLMSLYQTGVIEIRSLPNLELMKKSSLLSTLRWNFRANMCNMMSSIENGQIVLANGCELAFLSMLACENDFRIPESLPSLHDKVLAAAAAAAAAFSFSLNHKKKQETAAGIIGGIVKGLKTGKILHPVDPNATSKSDYAHLDTIFLKPPFPESPPSAIADNQQEVVELTIDDIDIDEPPVVASGFSNGVEHATTAKSSDREKLFDGGTDDWKPKMRTPEEIMATYRKTGDASSAAAHARNKLLERQEKLEKISKRTEDLRNNAEDFASLAHELVKTMEKRKWWHI